jgi:sulfotransferase
MNIEKQFFFMAGLPRSGSTVLSSILNQNENIFATPTSPLLDLLYLNEQSWRKCPSVIANPFPQQLESLSIAIINGCWEHVPQNIILDKHRGWGRNVPAIKHIFNIEPKVIITVRDIPSIIASFMSLVRNDNNPTNFVDSTVLQRNLPLNDMSRAKVIWENYVYDTWDSFKTAYTNNKENLILVDYDKLVSSPQEQISSIYKFLGIDNYNHSLYNIECKSNDDDAVAWGLSNLHKIRPELKKTSKPPIEILGEEIYYTYHNMNLEFWK